MNQGAGIGRYSRNIIRRLLPMFEGENTELWLARNREAKAASPGDAFENECHSAGVHFRESRLSRTTIDRWYFRFGLPLPGLLNTGAATVAYSPDFTVPAVSGNQIVTIHDLAWKRAPECVPSGLASFLDRAVSRQIRRSSRILTVSETVKLEIQRHYRVPVDQIDVASNAADQRFYDAAAPDAVLKKKYRLPECYLLMVGTIEPRKNHLNAIAAMGLMRSALPLVIVGSQGWSCEKEMKAIHRASEVIYTGYVQDEDLPSLYAGASALLAVSWYEGFDLPVIEGLAAGVPVVTSDLAVHREVAGSQAEFVDPASAESIASGIERALSQPGEEKKLAKTRRAEARKFEWRRSADVVANAIRMVGDS